MGVSFAHSPEGSKGRKNYKRRVFGENGKTIVKIPAKSGDFLSFLKLYQYKGEMKFIFYNSQFSLLVEGVGSCCCQILI
jgi:hypothetical protein